MPMSEVMIREVKIVTTGYAPEFGQTMGLIYNAITPSGTNTYKGQGSYRLQRQSMVAFPFFTQGERSSDNKPPTEVNVYTFDIGGPIVKNKVLFFLNPEFQQRTVPAGGPFIGSSGTSSSNVSQALVDRFNAALNKYGIPSGSGAAVNNDNPLTNVFARLDFNLTNNTSLVLRHNYAQAEDNVFSRSTSTFNLDNNGFFFTSKSHSTAA